MSGDPGKWHGTFETTHWSLVVQARDGSPSIRRETVGELLTRYLPPLRTHLLVRRGLSHDEVDDLLQDFVTERILERDLLSRVDQAKGKFRSFLLRSLDNYLIDQIRSRQARRRRGESPGSIDAEDAPEPVDPSSPADVFELAWARQVLSETLQRMRIDCLSRNRATIWSVFDCRLLQPALTGEEPVEYDALVERFSFASPAQASNSLITAKRHFQRTLEQVLTDFLVEPEQLAEEINTVASVLRQAGPLGLLSVGDSVTEPAPNEVGADCPSEHSTGEFDQVQSGRLAILLDNSTGSGGAEAVWQNSELPSVLEHLLSSDWSTLDPKGSRVTIRELLFSPTADIEQLRRLKSYSKKAAGGATQELPGEVASVLYYASLCAARLRTGQWTTTSNTEVVLVGLRMVLQHDWLPRPFVEMFRTASRLLKPA